MNSQVQEVVSTSDSLKQMAEQLLQSVAEFKTRASDSDSVDTRDADKGSGDKGGNGSGLADGMGDKPQWAARALIFACIM